MRFLFVPAFCVVLSTVGTAYGCHISGMPPHDVAIAASLALCVSSVTAFGAVLLASSRCSTPIQANPNKPR